jgi:hypothetical protein
MLYFPVVLLIELAKALYRTYNYYISMFTTIQIKKETLERLKTHKQYSRESYDGVLNVMLDEIEEVPLSSEEIADIKVSLDQLARGQTVPIEAVAKKLGISL